MSLRGLRGCYSARQVPFLSTNSVLLTPRADKNPICFLIKKAGLLFCPLSSALNVQMVFWLCLALRMRNASEPWALRCNNVFDLYRSYVSRFKAGILYDPLSLPIHTVLSGGEGVNALWFIYLDFFSNPPCVYWKSFWFKMIKRQKA